MRRIGRMVGGDADNPEGQGVTMRGTGRWAVPAGPAGESELPWAGPPERWKALLGQRWLVVAASAVAALSYSSFLLAPVLRPGVSSRGFVSELELTGQPYAWFFRLTDVAAGLGVLLLAACLRRSGERRRQESAGLALLALTGVASILDGISSMGCDPLGNPACARSEQSVGGLLGQLAALHSDTGLAGFAGAAAGAILLGAACYDRRPSLGTAQVLLGVLVAGCGLADVALLLAGRDLGQVERVRTLATSLWFVLLGASPRRLFSVPIR